MVRKTWAEGGSWATYFAVEEHHNRRKTSVPADKNCMDCGYSEPWKPIQIPLFPMLKKLKSDGTWDRN